MRNYIYKIDMFQKKIARHQFNFRLVRDATGFTSKIYLRNPC